MTDNFKITKQRGSGLGLYMCNIIAKKLTVNKKISV